MRTRVSKIEDGRCIGLLLSLVSAFSFQLSAFSQSYAIDWHTIDGGGGTSTGGVYSVSGTIGQAGAGTSDDQRAVFVDRRILVAHSGANRGSVHAHDRTGRGGAGTDFVVPGLDLKERPNPTSGSWGNSVSASTNPRHPRHAAKEVLPVVQALTFNRQNSNRSTKENSWDAPNE